MAYEFKLPDIGEGVVEGEIVRWLVATGDKVDEDQPMVEVMTDKATVEIPSPVKGTVTKTVGGEGDIIAVGDTLVVIDGGEEGSTEIQEQKGASAVEPGGDTEKSAAPEKKVAAGAGVLATPAVRKVAQKRGLDLSKVLGTGPGGRITKDDLDEFVKTDAVAAAVGLAEPEASIERIPYRGLRRRIGAHLTLSKRSAVHYTYVEEVDVTNLVELRDSLRGKGYEHLTYLPFVLKGIVTGLKKYPLMNSTLDEEREEILLKKVYHLGIATATEQGLVVPVVRDVDQKSLLELSCEIERLVTEARDGKSKLEDLKGSTFTVTSLGRMGGLVATPVINYPEVAILGVHRIEKRPVVRDGEIVIRDMMNLSLSADHRVVDGYVAAEFIHCLMQVLESPGLLLLSGEE
jgi:pyruvate dehydrogenase E2 component (dihydrolipoamide acetyltransferase)